MLKKIQSIEDYLNLHADDNQEAVASYLSKRCAATFLVVAKIFNNENKPDDKKVSDTMANSAMKMIEMATYVDASVVNRDLLEIAPRLMQRLRGYLISFGRFLKIVMQEVLFI